MLVINYIIQFLDTIIYIIAIYFDLQLASTGKMSIISNYCVKHVY